MTLFIKCYVLLHWSCRILYICFKNPRIIMTSFRTMSLWSNNFILLFQDNYTWGNWFTCCWPVVFCFWFIRLHFLFCMCHLLFLPSPLNTLFLLLVFLILIWKGKTTRVMMVTALISFQISQTNNKTSQVSYIYL